MIKNITEKLLGRSLIENDGINIEKIEETEIILGINLPKYLKDFYKDIGNTRLFTKSFERFIDIDKLFIMDNKLVFLEENQQVCIWGIDISKNDLIVYQNADEGWYSEEVTINEFIDFMLYYQCAQGYENVMNIDTNKINNENLLTLLKEMEKVVDNNHLIIYCNDNVLLWYYTDADNKILNNSIIISGLTENKTNEYYKKLLE